MTNRGKIAALALLVAAALPATSQAGLIGGVGTYFKDRFHDALDIVRLRAGAPRDGKAIGVKARVTSLVQVGYVSFDGTYAGMDRRAIGIVDERRREAGVSLLYGSYNEMEPRWGDGFLKGGTPWHEGHDRRLVRNLPHWDDGRQRPLSIGAEIATPLLALDAGVYPSEVLDFALGILTIDIYHDDELFSTPVRDFTPTVRPRANEEAPFADKRAKYAEFNAQMDLKEAEELKAHLEAADKNVSKPVPDPVDETEVGYSDSAPIITDEDVQSIMNAPADEENEYIDAPVAPIEPQVIEQPADEKTVDEVPDVTEEERLETERREEKESEK